MNTAAIRNPEIISKAAEQFGSSTIVVSIEAKKQADGTYEAYTDCGREKTHIEVMAWAKKVVDLGAGEIMITSIDNEGTGLGYDYDLVREITQSVPIPVIPGVGAFGLAMKRLKELDLIGILKEIAASAKPLMGICLGFQLMMSESFEFGHHEGLGLFKGKVKILPKLSNQGLPCKIPHVGWNSIISTGGEYISKYWQSLGLNLLRLN